MINILVFGYFGVSNLGDELFKEAFATLFPEYNFIFTSHFTKSKIDNCDAIIIGGGSFLFSDLNITPDLIELLKTKKLFYIGVGGETEISNVNQNLMASASLIALRSNRNLETIKKLNPNAIVIPDLVYALKDKAIISSQEKKSILFIPNFILVPQYSDVNWKFASWSYFLSEVSQWLDQLIDDGYSCDFLPMSYNKMINDGWAGVEICNKMKHRDTINLLPYSPNFAEVTEIISKYSAVISQRFHGLILADLLNIKHINIHHHDKLKYATTNGESVSYYGLNKSLLNEKFNILLEKNTPKVSIDLYTFNELVGKVKSIIFGGVNA